MKNGLKMLKSICPALIYFYSNPQNGRTS